MRHIIRAPHCGCTASTTAPGAWDDICWEMVTRCEQTDDGFAAPASTLVAEFCKRYPDHADDLVDFAATCRTMDFMAAKYPAPEPTDAELKKGVARAMRAFRAALKRKNTQP